MNIESEQDFTKTTFESDLGIDKAKSESHQGIDTVDFVQNWDIEQDLSGFKPVPKRHTFRTDFSKINKKKTFIEENPVPKKDHVPKKDYVPKKDHVPKENRESNKKQYLESLQEAREIALSELKFSFSEIMSNTTTDRNGSVAFKKTVLWCNNDVWKNDEIDLKGLKPDVSFSKPDVSFPKFSRHKFYLKREFKESLDKYYQDLGYSSKLILVHGNKWIIYLIKK